MKSKIIGYRGFDIYVDTYNGGYFWHHTTIFGMFQGWTDSSESGAIYAAKYSLDQYIDFARHEADNWEKVDCYNGL